MKTAIIAIFGLLLWAGAANAHGDGFGGFGDFGGFGFGGGGFAGHHGGGAELGGFGGSFGYSFFNVDRIQERYEDKLESLETQYDDGVATGDDFFTSTKYDRILDKTELLTDSYGLFVSGVERSIDRIGDYITTANDDLTYYNDLLADYQADDTLSETRLARIETWIGRVTDRLSDKIESLTETQTTLTTNLPTYQSFQTDVSTFLTTVTAGGSDATDGAASVKALAVLATSSSSDGDSAMCAAGSATLLAPGVVPEPSVAALVLLAGGALVAARRRRGQGT